MIQIFKGSEELKVQTFVFPGGEEGVKLDTDNLRYRHTAHPFQALICRIQRSSDVMQLVMVADALKRFDPTPIRLILPYVPYARQDRVCVAGEIREIFKDPKTDTGMKKSARGFLRVERNEAGELFLRDRVAGGTAQYGELLEVFRDSKLLIDHELAAIRARIASSL